MLGNVVRVPCITFESIKSSFDSLLQGEVSKEKNVPFLTLSLDPLDSLTGLAAGVVLCGTVVEFVGNVSELKQQ